MSPNWSPIFLWGFPIPPHFVHVDKILCTCSFEANYMCSSEDARTCVHLNEMRWQLQTGSYSATHCVHETLVHSEMTHERQLSSERHCQYCLHTLCRPPSLIYISCPLMLHRVPWDLTTTPISQNTPHRRTPHGALVEGSECRRNEWTRCVLWDCRNMADVCVCYGRMNISPCRCFAWCVYCIWCAV